MKKNKQMEKEMNKNKQMEKEYTSEEMKERLLQIVSEIADYIFKEAPGYMIEDGTPLDMFHLFSITGLRLIETVLRNEMANKNDKDAIRFQEEYLSEMITWVERMKK